MSARRIVRSVALYLLAAAVVASARINVSGPDGGREGYLGASSRFKAGYPVPANGARAGLLPRLEWKPGVTAAFHNIYLGTKPQLSGADLVAWHLQTPSCQVVQELVAGVTYYWRVDEVPAGTGTVEMGDVWSFTASRHGPVPDPNLVGWWKCDGLEDGLVVDSSGRDNHGIPLGNPQPAAGHLGGALSFDGLDDGVNCGSDPSLMSVDSVTVTAWVTLAALGGDRKIAGNPDGATGGYQLGVYVNDKIEFEIRTAGNVPVLNRDLPGGTVLSPDVWYHVAGVYEKGKGIRTYVNGKLDRALPTEAVAGISQGPLLLGHELCCGVNRWMGLLDDVRIYDRALAAEEIEWVMQGVPLIASDPQPASGASLEIQDAVRLTWLAGDGATMHDLYFGSDLNAVRDGNVASPVYRGRWMGTIFPLAELVEPGEQYFWRIDEVAGDGTTVYRGVVWTFAIRGYLIIDDFEHYGDQPGRRFLDTWIDGITNGTGSQANLGTGPFPAGTSAVHGIRSMVLAYNNAGPNGVSEVEREFDPARNWAAGNANTLSLWHRGEPVPFGETTPGTFVMRAAGADIWYGRDEFRYAYKPLDGDGEIVARVEAMAGVDYWTKAGVMIRVSLDPASAHASMFMIPSGVSAFQNRPVDFSSNCFSAMDGSRLGFPSWVKLERKGNQFTGYHSVNGVTWTPMLGMEADASPNPQTINMPRSVYIGLALGSHAAGVMTTATFSNVRTAGAVTGPWHVADIGVDHPGNSPGDLYVAIEDSNGVEAAVVHPDPGVVNITDWTEWKIPLRSFTGVNLGRVAKIHIGVVEREASILPGTGRLSIDDIHISRDPAAAVFGIYFAETGELVLSDQHMAAYIRATHEILLNESGIARWNACVDMNSTDDPAIPTRKGLYQKHFAARIDNREIYRGHFWSAVSSQSCDGIVILDAALRCDSVHNRISIENGYVSPLPSGGEDPRDDAELFDVLAAKGLLQ